MSHYKIESTANNCITCEKVACQNEGVTNPLTRKPERLSELLRELKEEQSGRPHKEITYFRATSSSSDSGHRSDRKHFFDFFQSSSSEIFSTKMRLLQKIFKINFIGKKKESQVHVSPQR